LSYTRILKQIAFCDLSCKKIHHAAGRKDEWFGGLEKENWQQQGDVEFL
jgi:hypothetical protein